MPKKNKLDQAIVWLHSDGGELPESAKPAWTKVGTGTVSLEKGFKITCSGESGYYFLRTGRRKRSRENDRIEFQIVFQGASSTPGWANPVSPHIIAIQDGNRTVGVSIGDQLTWVDPSTGDTIRQAVASNPWLKRSTYMLVKDESARWLLYLDSVLVDTLPYRAAPEQNGAAGVAWGFFDSTGSGVGTWEQPEAALNMALPHNDKVLRQKYAMGASLLRLWGQRHRAWNRTIVGTFQEVVNSINSLVVDHTAAWFALEEGEFSATEDPQKTGWTIPGTPGLFSIVRERIRITQSGSPEYLQFLFSTPLNAEDAIVYTKTSFRLVQDGSNNPRGRVGPFLQLRNADRRVTAILLKAPDNPNEYFWALSNSSLGGNIALVGRHLGRVDPFQEHTVELFILEQVRVILAVNGRVVEDIPYDSFTVGGISTWETRIGRDGSSDIKCVVDIGASNSEIAYSDERSRPLFLQRLAERLIFVGGCELNSRLDTWQRRRLGVHQNRGTNIGIDNEVRRITCDEEAEIITETFASDWYIEETFPEITPIFLESNSVIEKNVVEFQAKAPNFLPDELVNLIAFYIIPASTVESKWFAALFTFLTTPTVSGPSGSTFTVEKPLGFKDGDLITLREDTSGTALSVDYDNTSDLTDKTIKDFSGNGRDGALFGAMSELANQTGEGVEEAPGAYGGVVESTDPTNDGDGILSPSFASSGGDFTYAGFFKDEGTTGTIQYLAGVNTAGVPNGGWEFYKDAAGNLVVKLYSAIATHTTTRSYTATGKWTAFAFKYDSTLQTVTIWQDGAQVGSPESTGGFAPLALSDAHGFGCDGAGALPWLNDHRDHWVFSRALNNTEIDDLYQGSREDTPRFDASAEVAYIPRGYTATEARWDGANPQAEYASVSSRLSEVAAEFQASADSGEEYVGSITLAGRDGDKVNNIGTANTATVTGASAGVDLTVELIGLSSGQPTIEKLKVSGTTPAVGSVTWDTGALYGVVSDVNAQDTVTVTDTTTTNTLYVISAGTRTSGAYVFDPALFAGPTQLEMVSDGATIENMIAVGTEEVATDTAEFFALNGTTPVNGSTSFSTTRILAMGRIPGAQNVTITGKYSDPAGVLTVVSDNAGDTVAVNALFVGLDGKGDVECIPLNGTTPESGTKAHYKFAGAEIPVNGTGNITLTYTGGSVDVLVGSFDSSAKKVFSARKMNLQTLGTLSVYGHKTNTTERYVVIFGLNENGVMHSEAVAVGEEWKTLTKDFSRVLAIGTANLSEFDWVTLQGRAWRYNSVAAAVAGQSTSPYWSLSSSASNNVKLNNASRVDTLNTVLLSGTWSEGEDSSIITINPQTGEVLTPLLNGSFGAGTRMRQRNG